MENGKSTAPELAEKLEVSIRTIYRDIDIISSVGVPIYVTTGRNGGIQIDDSFVLDRLILSDKEKEIYIDNRTALMLKDIQEELNISVSSEKVSEIKEIDIKKYSNMRDINAELMKRISDVIYPKLFLCKFFPNCKQKLEIRENRN